MKNTFDKFLKECPREYYKNVLEPQLKKLYGVDTDFNQKTDLEKILSKWENEKKNPDIKEGIQAITSIQGR